MQNIALFAKINMANESSEEASKYSIAPASAILLRILNTSAVIGNVGHVSLRARAGTTFTNIDFV